MNYRNIILESLDKVASEHGYTEEIRNRDIHEQALSHRLAFHLENSGFFSGYQIDCEYNRYEERVKKNASGKPIRPDILVHIRGVQSHNLMIIQAKKFNDSKLEIKQAENALQSDKLYLKYKFAFLVVLPENLDSINKNSVIPI